MDTSIILPRLTLVKPLFSLFLEVGGDGTQKPLHSSSATGTVPARGRLIVRGTRLATSGFTACADAGDQYDAKNRTSRHSAEHNHFSLSWGKWWWYGLLSPGLKLDVTKANQAMRHRAASPWLVSATEWPDDLSPAVCRHCCRGACEAGRSTHPGGSNDDAPRSRRAASLEIKDQQVKRESARQRS
jgi:hypothetical protein